MLVPAPIAAQRPDGVVPITAEPDHKIRFDNGKVRMYEVILPSGAVTLAHEHSADNFTIFFRTAEITLEPLPGTPGVLQVAPGFVGYTSTAEGPYSHRVTVSGETTFHVIAMELMSPAPAGPATAARRAGSAFTVALENPRGRAYSITLAPGESTEAFNRPAGTALFAISSGRISELAAGQQARLWDFEPAHFRWFEHGETLSIKNEGAAPVELVAIEVF
jgi:hypothetical protein